MIVLCPLDDKTTRCASKEGMPVVGCSAQGCGKSTFGIAFRGKKPRRMRKQLELADRFYLKTLPSLFSPLYRTSKRSLMLMMCVQVSAVMAFINKLNAYDPQNVTRTDNENHYVFRRNNFYHQDSRLPKSYF